MLLNDYVERRGKIKRKIVSKKQQRMNALFHFKVLIDSLLSNYHTYSGAAIIIGRGGAFL